MISHIQKAKMNFLFATFHQPFPLIKTMHATGIHARDTFFILEWLLCSVSYNILSTPDKLIAVVKQDKFFLQNIKSRYSVHF